MKWITPARAALSCTVAAVLLLSMAQGCSPRNAPGSVIPSGPGVPPSPGAPAVPAGAPGAEPLPQNTAPFRKDGDRFVFGPFSSWVRGIDWFWCRDGRRLIVTSESEGSHRLWLIDAATGESRLLREVRGIEAMFPVGWAGDESITCMDLGCEPDQPSTISVTTFSRGGSVTRKIGEFAGWPRQHVTTPDGRYFAVHMKAPDGGKIWRLDTSDGSSTDLLSGLPTWDGLFPVWFSPDGRRAVMPEPEKQDSGLRRLLLLNLEDGAVTSIDPYFEIIDHIAWSPGGARFAHKIAAGDYRIVEAGDSYMALSGSIRIITSEGKVISEIALPQGRLVGAVAWIDDESLVLRESTTAEDVSGPVWFAHVSGELREAVPGEAQAFEREERPYPMAKGRSDRFGVSVRSWQDPGKAPSEELIVAPLE